MTLFIYRFVSLFSTSSLQKVDSGFGQRNPFKKSATLHQISGWRPQSRPLHIWEDEWSASTLEHLTASCQQQSCHELGIRNWNITSITGKEHELVEEGKRMLLAPHWQKFVFLIVQRAERWVKTFTPALNQQSLPRLGRRSL